MNHKEYLKYYKQRKKKIRLRSPELERELRLKQIIYESKNN